MKSCYKCGYSDENFSKVGFREECPKCFADLHVCVNCVFYDKAYKNECRETQAELVKDKEKANLCEYFRFKDKDTENFDAKKRNEAKKTFDSLFRD